MTNEIKLTEDQKKVVKLINDYLDSDTDFQPFTLSGIGGAGKTTVIREVTNYRSGVVGATVSHSAKFVLEKSLGKTAQCYTVAQLLGLVQKINDDGEISFIPNPSSNNRKKLPIESAKIVIIDECSMIDSDTLVSLMTMKDNNCKVIFMGDPFQLPSVKDSSDSITFNHVRAELLQAMRYSGPIADLGDRIRKEITHINEHGYGSKHLLNTWQTEELNNNCRVSLVNEDGSGYIFLNSIDDVVSLAINAFKESSDPDSMRLIAYKNKSIEKINDVIRAQLYTNGDEESLMDLPQFVPGELVICDGGYSVSVDNGYKVPVLYNNETYKVVGTIPTEGPNGINSLSMSLEPSPPLPTGCDITCLDWYRGRHDYFDKLNSLKKDAENDRSLWRRYYNFKQQWAWFDYAYAINSHKGLATTWPL